MKENKIAVVGDIILDSYILGEVTKISYSINCKNRTGAIRDIIIYSSNDTVLKTYSYKEGELLWGKITSHSFMNSFKKLLCTN